MLRKLSRDKNFLNQHGELHPATIDQIDRLEKRIEVNLPPLYKDFLIKYNGGVFNESLFEEATLGVLVASYFLPISESHENSMESEISFFLKEIGGGYIPIAIDPGGNYFLIGCEKDNFDGIYFWLHDRTFKDGARVNKISESFESFINNLQLDE
jgi:hypothetical protein